MLGQATHFKFCARPAQGTAFGAEHHTHRTISDLALRILDPEILNSSTDMDPS